MKIHLITILIILSTATANSSLKFNPNYIMKNSGIDETAKSSKGWLRVLNSDKKLNEYNIIITNTEKSILIEYFKSVNSSRERIIK